MSSIQKIPYIERVLKTLATDKVKDLLDLVNGENNTPEFRSLLNDTAVITTADKGVSYISLETKAGVLTGYLLYNNTFCTLVTYTRDTQDMGIYEIDIVNRKAIRIHEHLTILEFRTEINLILVEAGESVRVQTDDIDSEDATSGEVIMADGIGGASWQTVKVLDTDNATPGYVLTAGENGQSVWAQLGQVEGGDYVATFDNLEFSSDNTISISFTGSDERWTWMKATDKDCSLVLRLLDGTAIELKRVRYDLTEGYEVVEFGSTLNEEVDGNGVYMTSVYSARFTSAGGVAVKTELEANRDNVDGDNAYLANIVIGGETYYVLNPTDLEGAYAKVDGSYPLMEVGKADVADNITPYSDESGAFQDNPVISQGTGTDNNTAIVTTGNFAQLREKQGNTVVVAQIVNNSSTMSKTFDGTEQYFGVLGLLDNSVNITKDHKYVLRMRVTRSIANNDAVAICLGAPVSSVQVSISNGASNGIVTAVVIANDNYNNNYLYYNNFSGNQGFTAGDTISVEDVSLLDITSWPSDIIADLTAHPDHFSWYYNGPLTFNAGSLENSNGVKLVCTHRQLWDEEWEVGALVDGQPYAQANTIRSKNYIVVVPNRPYYLYMGSGNGCYINLYDKDKNFISSIYYAKGTTFVTSPNAVFAKFYTSGYGKETYAHDITISLYYTPEEGGEGYDQHYAYEEPTVVDTGSESLLAFDKKLPSGLIEYNTGEKTFAGDETWYFNSTYDFFYSANTGHKLNGRVKCSNGIVAKLNNASYIYIYLSDNPQLTSESNMNTIFQSGTTMQYELATTTEQGTPFPENVGIDDYGMMYWLDENDNLVGIPQGAKFFYPVNYKGFTDDLCNRTDGDAGNVVIQSELSASETARDSVDAQLKEALGGTLRQLLAATQSVDFANTAFVDLGELNWSYANGVFYAQVADKAVNNLKMLSTKYEIDTVNVGFAVSDKCIAVGSSNNYVYIKDTAYTDATAFKAAMKNVLLAYEKASE